MTAADYANLHFLMSASREELDSWYLNLSQDDLNYASALLIICELELNDDEVDLMDSYPDALAQLNKLRYQT